MVAINNSINNTIGAANSGVTNTLTITNPSNTASSQALTNITVGGTSSGDAFTTYTVAGTTNWSQGIDNSVAGDPYVLAASTALGTTNVMSATTAGAVSFVLGNVDVTRSASGATVSTTVSNTSNTASSVALQQVTVAGTSAGDARTTYTVTGTTNWSQGIDNSVAGDPFVLAASTSLGTTDVMSITTAGNTTITSTGTSASLTLNNRNLDTNAASTSVVQAAVVTGSAADAYMHVAIESTSNYAFGIDNSDSDALKICFSASATTPSGTASWKMTTAGERTMPLQPAFLARTSADINDVTGDGTTYTIIFDTEVFDQNSDYNNGTGVFTAPVTGRYLVSWIIVAHDFDAAHTRYLVTLVYSNFTNTQVDEFNPGVIQVANNLRQSSAHFIGMDAADTAQINFLVSGGTKVIDINGTGTPHCFFGGALVC